MTAQLKHIEKALDDLKGQDIVIIPLEGKASFADYMVIATGTSARHAASLSDSVVDTIKRHQNRAPHVEGKHTGEWVCVDDGDIVVHIFQPGTRRLYNLEKLWSF